MIKELIIKKGYRTRWLAEQIGVNYNSLRVYINNENLMPDQVKEDLLKILNKK
jgi:hypothetical protein